MPSTTIPTTSIPSTTTSTSRKPYNSAEEEEESNGPSEITDDICLLPGGDPLVRVETAPSNARRIFTAIDILAAADDVWAVLTAYETLHHVVPSLVKNNVVYRTENGARLFQVGGAKVLPGVTFTAKTVLDVVTYLEGMLACTYNDFACTLLIQIFKLLFIIAWFVKYTYTFYSTALFCADVCCTIL